MEIARCFSKYLFFYPKTSDFGNKNTPENREVLKLVAHFGDDFARMLPECVGAISRVIA